MLGYLPSNPPPANGGPSDTSKSYFLSICEKALLVGCAAPKLDIFVKASNRVFRQSDWV